MDFRKMLVPVDYSQHSKRALTIAGELAQRYSGKLAIVHVWDRPTYLTEAIMVGHVNGPRRLTDLIVENAEQDMKAFLAEVALPAGVEHGDKLLSGDPASELLKEIEHGGYDLVVLGSHGRSGLERLMMGSVAEKIVRHSRVPVLTVPRPH
jgi:nucleotide-binding universal stress UspA family protein